MRTLAGLGLQGAGRELEAARDLGVKDFLLLVPEGILGGDLQRLIDLIPDVIIVLRFFHPDRMGELPEHRAADDWRFVLAHTTVAQREHIVGVIPANELNLDAEHDWRPYAGFWKGREAYIRIDNWLCGWAKEWRQINTHTGWQPKLHWPGLAPGLNPPGLSPESEYEFLLNSLRAYDVIDLHVYGNEDPDLAWDEWEGVRRLDRICAKLTALALDGKPRSITEVNRVSFVALCEYATQYHIERAYWFLWRGNPDHAALDLKPPYTNGLTKYIAEGGDPPMPSKTLSELTHEIWDDGCRWQDKPPPLGYNPGTGLHDYIERSARLIGVALTNEYDSLCGDFTLIRCAIALVIYEKRGGRIHAAESAAALQAILARWGYPKA